jgi:hypothetical protein
LEIIGSDLDPKLRLSLSNQGYSFVKSIEPFPESFGLELKPTRLTLKETGKGKG